jgi:hypothetical protein
MRSGKIIRLKMVEIIKREGENIMEGKIAI